MRARLVMSAGGPVACPMAQYDGGLRALTDKTMASELQIVWSGKPDKPVPKLIARQPRMDSTLARWTALIRTSAKYGNRSALQLSWAAIHTRTRQLHRSTASGAVPQLSSRRLGAGYCQPRLDGQPSIELARSRKASDAGGGPGARCTTRNSSEKMMLTSRLGLALPGRGRGTLEGVRIRSDLAG